MLRHRGQPLQILRQMIGIVPAPAQQQRAGQDDTKQRANHNKHLSNVRMAMGRGRPSRGHAALFIFNGGSPKVQCWPQKVVARSASQKPGFSKKPSLFGEVTLVRILPLGRCGGWFGECRPRWSAD